MTTTTISTSERTGHVATDGARRSDAVRGVYATIPLLAGLAPLALVVGATAAESTAGPVAGFSTSWMIFGATAQLVALRLLDAGTAPIIVVASVMLTNLRLGAYGASMAGRWRHRSRRWRLLASGLLVEPSYAVANDEAATGDDRRDATIYLTAALTFFAGWQLLTLAGVLAGDRVAAAIPTDLAIGVALTAMAVPLASRTSASTATAVTAAAIAALTTWLPQGTGILVAGTCGVVVGHLVEGSNR
jgi:predicted branched-subunit amino acid permease